MLLLFSSTAVVVPAPTTIGLSVRLSAALSLPSRTTFVEVLTPR